MHLADATHLRAQMVRFHIHRHAVRLGQLGEGSSDLVGHPLLDAETASGDAHQPGQLADADDVLMGDVADEGAPKERQDMVLAQGGERIGPSTTWDSSQLAPP